MIAAPDFPYQSGFEGFNASGVGTVWVMKFENNAWVTEQRLTSPAPAALEKVLAPAACEDVLALTR